MEWVFVLLLMVVCASSSNLFPQEYSSERLDHTDISGQISSRGNVALVKSPTSKLYLCLATFITKSHLLTAASCLYNTKPIDMYVQYNIARNGKQEIINVGVRNIFINPYYSDFMKNSDVAIIQLLNSVEPARLFRLPSPEIPVHDSTEVYTFRWKLEAGEKPIKKVINTLIDRNNCSKILNKYVNCDRICTKGSQLQNSESKLNLGSPLCVNIKRKDDLTWRVIVGLYTDPESSTSKVEIYQDTRHYAKWLKSITSMIHNESFIIYK